jgi:hypothetical protein
MSDVSNLSLFAAIHAVSVAFICFLPFLVPLLCFTSQGSGQSSLRVAAYGQTRIKGLENLSSYLTRGRSNCIDRNTKRGKTLARSLCQVPSILKFSNVSRDDRFAAQIVYSTGRCPSMSLLVVCCGSFQFIFCFIWAYNQKRS